MVKVAVTGVTGMIGGAVAKRFVQHGYTVRGIARRQTQPS